MRTQLVKTVWPSRAKKGAAVACCVLAALQLFAVGASAQRRRRAPPPALQDARVAEIANEYLRGHYSFNPTEGTAAGLHEYDSALESRSREAVAAEARRLRGVIAALARVNESRLSAEARYDFLWLSSHARARLLELEDVRTWQRDPGLYSRLVAASFDNILKRDYAPVERRLDALVARARQASRLLSEGRANVENPPRVYTETAAVQVAGTIDFFSRAVPQMFERAGGGRLSAARRSEFAAAVESVTAALRSYSDWLQSELLPRSNGDFRIGAENFRKKLLYEEMIDAPLQSLLRDGERELRRTQEEMRRVAEEIAPDRDLRDTLRALGRERPSAEGLVGETRSELNRIRAFVRERDILTPPASENLIVAETPSFRRLGFASMDAPGPFERAATESYYYVTPPDPAWDARRREEHLSFFNRSSLPIVSIHEAFPGHYYQLLAARRSPSRVRAAFGSASFVEGWAHYCEQMMIDEGFGGGSPKLRLAQLHAALTRLCRYLAGLLMHTEGMTYEQAVELFVREGYMEQANAEREARRGTLDPTYLVYTLGKLEILKLRDDYRRARGEAFRLGEFHDRLLSHGMPPVKIIRLALLGDAASSAQTVAGPAATDDRTNVVEFSVVATGAMSAYEGGRRVELISNEDDWRQAWAQIGGGRPVPDINFATRAVVVVYQGQKPTGGYSVAVDEIRRDGTALAVRVNERRPASGSITTQVITSPFVAVSVPRPAADSTVRFADEAGVGAGVESGPQKSQKNVTTPARRAPPRRRGRRGRSL